MTSQLTLSNRLEDLNILADWINVFIASSNISERSVFCLHLIAEEVFTNIINNAYDDNELHSIFLRLSKDGEWIELYIKDNGKQFNPLSHPKVIFPNCLDAAQVGGLGIHLICSYTDECHYERNNNENILVLRVYNSSK